MQPGFWNWQLFLLQFAFPQNCPNGTYNKFTGLTHVRECQTCTEGWYCEPSGQQTPTAKCPPGFFCPSGTGYKHQNPCPVGFYRNASAAISGMDCSVCIAGSYCNAEGLPFPIICPPVCFVSFPWFFSGGIVTHQQLQVLIRKGFDSIWKQ